MKSSKYNFIKKINDTTLIYNSITSGILTLNKEYTNKFERVLNGDFSNCEDLIEQLKKGGMLTESNISEFDKIKLKSIIARFSNKSLNFTIAPTLECNFACTYCYEEGHRSNTMNDNVIEKTIEFIKNKLQGITSIGVAWYGGEPILALDIIKNISKSILHEINSRNINYSAIMVTNGYMLSRQIAIELKDLKIRRVQITIDGPEKIHDTRRFLRSKKGTYRRIYDNISECCDIIPLVIRINVDKSNFDYLEELLDDLMEFKDKVSVYIAPVDNINNPCLNDCFAMKDFSVEEVLFYKKALNKGFKILPNLEANPYICGAVSANSYIIDPLGDLYKCWNHIGQSEEKVGSIFNSTFNDNIYKWLLYDPFEAYECKECSMLPICMGGCPYKRIKQGRNECRSIYFNVEDIINLIYLNKSNNM